MDQLFNQIKTGKILAFLGVFFLILRNAFFPNNLYLILPCLLLSLLGVFITVRYRVMNKEARKLINPLLGVLILFITLYIYLTWFSPRPF